MSEMHLWKIAANFSVMGSLLEELLRLLYVLVPRALHLVLLSEVSLALRHAPSRRPLGREWSQ